MSLQHRLPDQVVRADPWTFRPQNIGPATNSFRNNDQLSKSARLFDKTVGGHQ
jgi:hypothetical protein